MEEGAAYDDGYDYGGYEEEEGYEGGLVGPGGEQNKGKIFLLLFPSFVRSPSLLCYTSLLLLQSLWCEFSLV